jgi:putative membrane protein
MKLSRVLWIAISSAPLVLFSVSGAAGAQVPSGSPQSPQSQPSSPGSPGAGPTTPSTMPETTPVRVDDKKFVKDAALGGMTEVELGKLASQKASSDAVKQFATKMVDDHSKANGELKEVASKSSIDIPDALDSKHQSRIDKLSKLSGADFDKAYVKDQVKDHEQTVSEFQNEAQNGTDANVRQFAGKTLPTLQEHTEMVKGLNKSMKKEKGGK